MLTASLLGSSASAVDIRFAIVGDFGDDSADETRVANKLKSFGPSYVATVGDNHYFLNGSTAAFDQTIGSRYGSFIKYPTGSTSAYANNGLTTNNFFPALGNHDIDPDGEGNDTDRGVDPAHPGAIAGSYTKYFDLPGNERYYDVVRDDVHLFVLSSDPRETDGFSPGTIQRTWFDNAINTSTSKWKVVLFHHAAYGTDDPTGSHSSNAYMQWDFSKATAVYAGHSHVYERNTVNGVTYIVDGAGGNETSTFESTLASQGIVGVSNYRDTSGPDGASQHGFTLVDVKDHYYTSKHFTDHGHYMDHVTFVAPGVDAVQTREFKKNVNGYNGTIDTQLTQASPNAAVGSAVTMKVDSDEPFESDQNTQVLIRFDGLIGSGASQVPAGATITSAKLRLQLVDGGDGFSVHRMLANWGEGSTWNSTVGGIALDGVEAVAAYDQTVGVGNESGDVVPGIFNLDVTNSVQAWANGAINMGWVLSWLDGGNDGLGIASANSATPPELIIDFTNGLRGDFNGDGLINATDITQLFTALSGPTPPAIAVFDLDRDGVVTKSVNVAASDADIWVRDVKRTEYGDLNLDGTIGFDDLLAFAQNYGEPVAGWSLGNIDGVTGVNFDDLLLLAQNYGFGGPALSPAAFDADWALARSLVPEPASALVLGVACMASRRRR